MTQPPRPQPGQWQPQPGYPPPPQPPLPSAAPKPKRRKWPYIVAAPFVLFVLVGIVAVSTSDGQSGINAGLAAGTGSSTAAAAPAPAATTEASPAAPADTNSDPTFVISIQGHGVPFDDKDRLVKLGHMNCESFDRGDKLLDVAQATITYSTTSGMATKAWTPEQAGFVIGAAVVAYCPQHADLLTG